MPLVTYNHAINPDVYANRPDKPVWTKEKEKPLREQKIELVMPDSLVGTGSVALLHYSVYPNLYLRDCQPHIPSMEPLKPKKSSRKDRDDLIKQFPAVPTSFSAVSKPLNPWDEGSYYNSCDWPRNSALDIDPFRRSDMRPPIALPNPGPKQPRYQHNLFPVLGSRDAVAHTNLLPEWGAKEHTRKLHLKHEGEREAIQRSLGHGRDVSATIQPNSSLPRLPESMRRHERVHTVDNNSRDSIIRLSHQRFASNSIRPSRHLPAHMELGAHAVHNGAERRVIYQQSHAAAPQHAYIHGDPRDLAQAVAQPIAPLDARGGSDSYQQSTTASSQYNRSGTDWAGSKHSCGSNAITLDTRVVADATHTMHPTIKPTLPLKLPRNKLLKSSYVDISMPLPLLPFKSSRKNPSNQVPIHPHVAFDGSIKLMAENDFPPSTRDRHRKGITRAKLSYNPRL